MRLWVWAIALKPSSLAVLGRGSVPIPRYETVSQVMYVHMLNPMSYLKISIRKTIPHINFTDSPRNRYRGLHNMRNDSFGHA